jgi:hypothetical protein
MAFGLSAGAVSAIGAIGGGLIAANGAKSAANTQAGAADRAGQLQNEQYQQSRADQQAQIAQQRADTQQYRDAGYTALSQLSGGTAPGGEFNRNFSMADYTADPGYQFRLDQGEQGINRAATASGSRYSGATLKALSRFNSGLASQEYGNAYSRFNSDVGNRFGRLASMAGIGQAATTQVGQGGQNGVNQMTSAGTMSANGQAGSVQNAGAARASGYVGVGNSINGTIGGLVNNYGQQQMLSSMAGNGLNNYNGTSSGYMDPRALPDSATVQAAGGWGIE